MRTRVVFVGAATYDAISLVPSYPGADERVQASQLVFAGGGPASTAAVAAHRLGIEVTLIAPVGSDSVGALIVDDLKQLGISPEHLQRCPDRKSQASAIVCSADIAARAITTLGVEPFTLSPENAAIVRAAEWVHVDHLGWPAVEAALAGVPDDERPKISVDAGHALIGAERTCDPSRVALYVPPFEKLPQEPGQSDVETLRSVGAQTVVATMGGDGALGVSADGSAYSVPGHRIEELGSTLGAGDVFHGALVAAVASGESLPDSIRLANAVAALSCRGVDGRSRIPTREEVDRFLADTSTASATEEALR
jgi:sulfofructose kinase